LCRIISRIVTKKQVHTSLSQARIGDPDAWNQFVKTTFLLCFYKLKFRLGSVRLVLDLRSERKSTLCTVDINQYGVGGVNSMPSETIFTDAKFVIHDPYLHQR
jgi:hypothetical protein